MNPIDIAVGAVLRNERESRGLTQAQLAEALGASVAELQKFEAGEVRLGARRMYAACTFLDVPVTRFFKSDLRSPLCRATI